MAAVGAKEKHLWEERRPVYEDVSTVLDTSIRLVQREYDRKYVKVGYNEIIIKQERIKEIESSANKLEKDGHEFSIDNIDKYIHDIVGHRVVLLTKNDVAAFALLFVKMMCNTPGVRVLGYKDFISNPKQSGYRNLHFRLAIMIMTEKGPEEIITEVQIGTLVMYAFAKIEHKLKYKFKNKRANKAGEVMEQLSPQLIAYGKMGDIIDSLAMKLLVPDGEFVSYEDAIKQIEEMIIDSNIECEFERKPSGIMVKDYSVDDMIVTDGQLSFYSLEKNHDAVVLKKKRK